MKMSLPSFSLGWHDFSEEADSYNIVQMENNDLHHPLKSNVCSYSSAAATAEPAFINPDILGCVNLVSATKFLWVSLSRNGLLFLAQRDVLLS